MQKEVDKFIVIPREAFDLHRMERLSSSGLLISSLSVTLYKDAELTKRRQG